VSVPTPAAEARHLIQHLTLVRQSFLQASPTTSDRSFTIDLGRANSMK
jgi:hypothetical protein